MSTQYCLYRASSRAQLDGQIEWIKKKIESRGEQPGYMYDGGVRAQVFRLNKRYYFRILFRGWGVDNLLMQEPKMFPQSFYDSRSQRMQVRKENFADKIDKAIFQKEYEVIEIIPAKIGHEE